MEQVQTAENILGQLLRFQTKESPEKNTWLQKWSNSHSRPYWKNISTGEKTWYHPNGKKRKQKQQQQQEQKKTKRYRTYW